ncbi:uL15m family ribosomal protein [Picrophilus oshimae]|uniref:Large ribosomal subunit protein uL15 n=1 Tax=Picrophilus torridus (strain ATCC 700027 / DSM 9790 / JCM 10055 / NBRC 100828 / KAW 2/3) TaxID=1122961 RepID=Q6L1A5_PICTO|nr:uL15m family ribosomal protein [Picrophilus oshimae]AAT43247.1 large subunit ribosomal protein L15P [Picrophilus oshimae DSM 9789]SMD30447.1 LSU ribosomal protein L15P [Picrophilus oshimae DSM 9789]
MVRTRTKKLRGGHYGRGMKAGRGKGKKGGNGMAGLGKHRWVWLLKYDRDHFGVHGFKSHSKKYENPITLEELANIYDKLKENGFVHDDVIDLEGAGYTKLLGTGDFDIKSRIKIERATEKAINKLSVHGITIENDE